MATNDIFDKKITVTAYERENGKGEPRLCQRRIRATEKPDWPMTPVCAARRSACYSLATLTPLTERYGSVRKPPRVVLNVLFPIHRQQASY
jgi:hypothetical protein